jgi:uncharacterized repeat protein (TIGR03803 family)
VARAWWPIIVCLTSAVGLSAQKLATIYSFGGADGGYSLANLIQATDGNLYGTTSWDGTNLGGTVFRISPTGNLTVLYNFCAQAECADGAQPYSGLIQGVDGNFYGTTLGGGENDCSGMVETEGCGAVFKITPQGTLTTLYSFCAQTFCADGEWPYAGLIQASDGNLYGTTSAGGLYNMGEIFKISTRGTFSTIYSFCEVKPACPDGDIPYGGLVQGRDGNLYGTTTGFNENEGTGGTVFKITPAGTLTTLYSFCSLSQCADGAGPSGTLVQAGEGTFYGTTFNGGAYGYGTVFKMTPAGFLTTLYSFCSQSGCVDGSNPYAGLVRATNGAFYGTTARSGANGNGTAFAVTEAGGFLNLYSFCALSLCSDGREPFGGLIQDTNGRLYGTTFSGGVSEAGTVFSVNLGLRAFIETQPTSGKVGTPIKIMGTNLNGATALTFNGMAALFKIISGSLITTAVPAGATSGTVQVTTPQGTFSSNVPFQVSP